MTKRDPFKKFRWSLDVIRLPVLVDLRAYSTPSKTCRENLSPSAMKSSGIIGGTPTFAAGETLTYCS